MRTSEACSSVSSAKETCNPRSASNPAKGFRKGGLVAPPPLHALPLHALPLLLARLPAHGLNPAVEKLRPSSHDPVHGPGGCGEATAPRGKQLARR